MLTVSLLLTLLSVAHTNAFTSVSLKKKGADIHSHLLRASDDAADPTNVPAGGSVWPTAIYWVFIQVGTPPVEFPVAIDSGSETLDIGAQGCDGCTTKPPNNQYDYTTSSTSKPVVPYTFSNTYETCDLSNMTAPCTIKGRLYSDMVSIAGLGPVEVNFGAITFQTNNFDQFAEINGVMGFIGSGKGSVFAQLVAAGLVPNDVYALCIHHGSTSNGTLTLGGVDSRLYTGAITYVPNINSVYYEVTLNDLQISAGATPISIDLPNKAAILDTGTNILLLPTPSFTSMSNGFEQLCKQGNQLAGVCGETNGTLFDGKCFPLTDAEISAYPSLEFKLDQGLTLEMKNTDYLLKGDKRAQGDESLVCLGVRPTGQTGFLIIGDTLMRNYYLIFDRAKKSIGWAAVNTDNCGSL